MVDHSRNPFDGLAAGYQKSRPDYPVGLLARICERVAPGASGNLLRAADIGSGTGISTRALKRALGEGWDVTGVEPGSDMRREAELILTPGVRYIEGEAEALPFTDASLALVGVGQAIHFFNRPAFYAEAGRVLVGSGCLAVFQNERQWQNSALLDSYESFVEDHDPSYRRDYRAIDLLSELREIDWAEDAWFCTEAWELAMTPERFVAMTLSRRTMRPLKDKFGERGVTDAMQKIANRHLNDDGHVVIPYVTELYMARKVS